MLLCPWHRNGIAVIVWERERQICRPPHHKISILFYTAIQRLHRIWDSPGSSGKSQRISHRSPTMTHSDGCCIWQLSASQSTGMPAARTGTWFSISLKLYSLTAVPTDFPGRIISEQFSQYSHSLGGDTGCPRRESSQGKSSYTMCPI